MRGMILTPMLSLCDGSFRLSWPTIFSGLGWGCPSRTRNRDLSQEFAVLAVRGSRVPTTRPSNDLKKLCSTLSQLKFVILSSMPDNTFLDRDRCVLCVAPR